MHPLDQIVWNSLAGPHSALSSGTTRARRYLPEYTSLIGFEDNHCPAWNDLDSYTKPGESFYCLGWSGTAPPTWEILAEKPILLMTWSHHKAVRPTSRATITVLGPAHVDQAIELAQLTNPGPFGKKTLELGLYVGYLEDERLIAMAGERMHASHYREISAVCTHPDFQGRGLAKSLMNHILQTQLARKQIPFLHVLKENTRAISVYHELGFETYCEQLARVVRKKDGESNALVSVADTA